MTDQINRPLSGVRVIGLEQYMAGPYCTMLLADAGAELRERIGQGATILVCGSLEGMAQSVHEALIAILGEATLNDLAEAGRYKRDVY